MSQILKGKRMIEKTNYGLFRKLLAYAKFTVWVGFLGWILPINAIKTPAFLMFLVSGIAIAYIYVEDHSHTKKQIKERLIDGLSSKLTSSLDNPQLYLEFEKHIENIVKEWIPDRDHKELGYLPKPLLHDQSLGMDIAPYWPESTEAERKICVALKFDDLVLDVETGWNQWLEKNWLDKYKQITS